MILQNKGNNKVDYLMELFRIFPLLGKCGIAIYNEDGKEVEKNSYTIDIKEFKVALLEPSNLIDIFIPSRPTFHFVVKADEWIKGYRIKMDDKVLIDVPFNAPKKTLKNQPFQFYFAKFSHEYK